MSYKQTVFPICLIFVFCLLGCVSDLFAAPDTKKKGKVLELKQLSVKGTIQRPSAAYLLQRRKLKFRGLEPKKSLLPAILKSVEHPPF